MSDLALAAVGALEPIVSFDGAAVAAWFERAQERRSLSEAHAVYADEARHVLKHLRTLDRGDCSYRSSWVVQPAGRISQQPMVFQAAPRAAKAAAWASMGYLNLDIKASQMAIFQALCGALGLGERDLLGLWQRERPGLVEQLGELAKTMLYASLFGAVVSGEEPTPMSASMDDDDELRKTIVAVLSEGERVLLLDNIVGEIGPASMAVLATSDTFRGRILGQSRMLRLPNRGITLLTANNPTFSQDMIRRVLPIRLAYDGIDPTERATAHGGDASAAVARARCRRLRHPHPPGWGPLGLVGLGSAGVPVHVGKENSGCRPATQPRLRADWDITA